MTIRTPATRRNSIAADAAHPPELRWFEVIGVPGVNLQDAAKHLGVHYQTAYRWVRNGSLLAVKYPVTGYTVTEAELSRFAALRDTATPPPETLQVRDWTPHVTKLLAALVAGDEAATKAVVDRLIDGAIGVVDLCEQLLAPCLAEIGARWHRGEVSIAVEHRATAICERTLARVATHPRGRPRGTAVVTTAQGDLHVMASVMAALALRDDHWKTHHLGADIPIDDVVSLVEDVDADLTVISLTNPDAKRKANALRARLMANDRRVLVGAPGMSLTMLVEQARDAR